MSWDLYVTISLSSSWQRCVPVWQCNWSVWRKICLFLRKKKTGELNEQTCLLCQRHTVIIYILWMVECIFFAGLWYYEYESQYGYDHSYYAFIAHFLVAMRMRCCDQRKKPFETIHTCECRHDAHRVVVFFIHVPELLSVVNDLWMK